MTTRTLFYGDNLDILRRKVKDETVDLCYIDPPFNSKRNYNQIYNNIGSEDRAQAQAFVDTWTWDTLADAGLTEILDNEQGRFTQQTVALINGLHNVLGKGSLLAYLVSMTLRIVEIHRVLKSTGSFYLHCDPTASHYLKLVCDGVFCGRGLGGDFKNEIIWHYRRWTAGSKTYQKMHDVLFWYTKTKDDYHFEIPYEPYGDWIKKDYKYVDEETGKRWRWHTVKGNKYKVFLEDADRGVKCNDVWQLNYIGSTAKERLGYPTQKPEALLERVIKASTNEGDLVLDAYCGCGTTVAVAERLKRQWIGIDITYQSVSLILKRLEDAHGKSITDSIKLDGVPRDMESAEALALRQDDRTRKEFEKWAVLTYTNNRGVINEKKGADKGIDGTVHFLVDRDQSAMMVLQVKSGKVRRDTIATLHNDMLREGAVMATLITLNDPTKPMLDEARDKGQFTGSRLGSSRPTIQIVTIQEILDGKRLDLPSEALPVLKSATPLIKTDGGEDQPLEY